MYTVPMCIIYYFITMLLYCVLSDQEASSTKSLMQDLSYVDNHSSTIKNQELCPLPDVDITSEDFTNAGGVVVIEKYGVKVTIPNGAIEDHHIVEIQVAASLFGPFNIPNNCHPVSAYVWMGANYTFKKLIEIEFEHHADISNSKNILQLCILKACCTKCNSNHPLMYEITQEYVISDSICTLYTNHFCSYCL